MALEMDSFDAGLDLKSSRRKQQNPKHHSHSGISKAGDMDVSQEPIRSGTPVSKSGAPSGPPRFLNVATVPSPDTKSSIGSGSHSPDGSFHPLVHSLDAKDIMKEEDEMAGCMMEKDAGGKITRRFQCNECGRLLSTSTSLERHMLTHSGQRPFPCPLCPICFTTNGNLLRHLKSCHDAHGSESSLSKMDPTAKDLRPAKSPVSLRMPNSLINALAIKRDILPKSAMNDELTRDSHNQVGSETEFPDATKYKPFLCTLCDKVFSTRTNCERHIRNRHSDKTYSRQELVKLIKFIPKNAADSHAVCKYCKKDYVSSKMLKHHLRSPYSSCRRKPFACKLCEATFSTRNNCIRHITNLHPDRKSEYKSLIVLNAPVSQADDEAPEVEEDDMSPPTMLGTFLSPGPSDVNFSVRSNNSGGDADSTDRDEAISEAYSPENYSAFSPDMDHHEQPMPLRLSRFEDPLDLSIPKSKRSECFNECGDGPLDLSMKKPKNDKVGAAVSLPTNWFSRSQLQAQVPVHTHMVDHFGGSKKHGASMITVASLMERTVPRNDIRSPVPIAPMPLKSSANVKRMSQEGERPGKRDRPFICPYCGIGFTIRGNMYRHFRHKHPEHNSKRRGKKGDSESDAKELDSTLDSAQIGLISIATPSPAQPVLFNGDIKHDDEDMELSDPVHRPLSIDEHGSHEEPQPVHSDVGQDSDRDGSHNQDETSSNNSKKRLKINSYSASPHNHVCSECGAAFPWQSSLERHMFTHTGMKPFACKWCDLRFSIKSNCERHCLRIHGKSLNKARKERRNPGNPIKCPLCAETFAYKINCERHCLDVHKQHYENLVTSSGAEGSVEGDQPPSMGKVKRQKGSRKGSDAAKSMMYYPCMKCPSSFDNTEDLQLHEENNHFSMDMHVDDQHDQDSNSSYSGSLVVDA